MNESPRDTPDPLEARLRALAPAAPRLDRAAVLAAAEVPVAPVAPPARAGVWKLAAVAGWAAAAGVAAAWGLSEPAVRVEVRTVEVPPVKVPAVQVPAVEVPAPAERPPALPDPPAWDWPGDLDGGTLSVAGVRPAVGPAAAFSSPAGPGRPVPLRPPPTAWELSRRWRDGRR